MMLRQRVVVTSLLLAVPATAAVAWTIERMRANDRELAVSRMVASQINDQVKERCESDPTWFLAGPLIGRPPSGVFVESFPDEPPPRPRVEPQPFELFAYDGQLLGSSPASPRLPEGFRRVLRFQQASVSAPYVTESGTGVQVAMPTGWIDGPCAYFLGRMDAPPHQLRQRVLTILGVFVVTFLVALGATAQMVYRVRRLAQDAREAVDDNHASIAPDRLRDELSSLTFVLNDTSQALHERRTRIDDLNDALRRFVRTTDEDVARPLERLERHLATMSAASSPSLGDVREALSQAHGLSGQIENLTAAARLRMLGPSPDRARIDLRAVVSRVVDRHQPLADAGGVALRAELPPDPVGIDADESLVERAIANVVDNAVRYNRPGGDVTVTLRVADGRFRLSVTDNGPGVSDEHFRGLTAIRRFRGDEGRNRRPGAPGLGLAIAREVCDRFGLSLDLKRPGAGGFEVEISGPI